MMVGCFKTIPAVADGSHGLWLLPSPAGWGYWAGQRRRAGQALRRQPMLHQTPARRTKRAVMWDLGTLSIVETPNPLHDVASPARTRTASHGHSPTGAMWWAIRRSPRWATMMVFIYDREQAFEPHRLRLRTRHPARSPLKAEGLRFIDQANFSPDGEWSAGRPTW